MPGHDNFLEINSLSQLDTWLKWHDLQKKKGQLSEFDQRSALNAYFKPSSIDEIAKDFKNRVDCFETKSLVIGWAFLCDAECAIKLLESVSEQEGPHLEMHLNSLYEYSKSGGPQREAVGKLYFNKKNKKTAGVYSSIVSGVKKKLPLDFLFFISQQSDEYMRLVDHYRRTEPSLESVSFEEIILYISIEFLFQNGGMNAKKVTDLIKEYSKQLTPPDAQKYSHPLMELAILELIKKGASVEDIWQVYELTVNLGADFTIFKITFDLLIESGKAEGILRQVPECSTLSTLCEELSIYSNVNDKDKEYLPVIKPFQEKLNYLTQYKLPQNLTYAEKVQKNTSLAIFFSLFKYEFDSQAMGVQPHMFTGVPRDLFFLIGSLVADTEINVKEVEEYYKNRSGFVALAKIKSNESFKDQKGLIEKDLQLYIEKGTNHKETAENFLTAAVKPCKELDKLCEVVRIHKETFQGAVETTNTAKVLNKVTGFFTSTPEKRDDQTPLWQQKRSSVAPNSQYRQLIEKFNKKLNPAIENNNNKTP